MKFVDDVNIEKNNRHFCDDNDSRRYYQPVDLIAFDIINNLTDCKYSFLWILRIEMNKIEFLLFRVLQSRQSGGGRLDNVINDSTDPPERDDYGVNPEQRSMKASKSNLNLEGYKQEQVRSAKNIQNWEEMA